MKTAVIFGAGGQDGSYLAEYLITQNYKVIGVTRRSSVNTLGRLDEAGLLNNPNFSIEEGDITDYSSVTGIMKTYHPDECYNLAAQSHVGTSFKQPLLTFQVDAVGVLNILEAIRMESPKTRFYQASTSELFGDNFDENEDGEKYQDEDTEFAPRSPYAVAKIAAHELVHTYRESYGLHASCGILFNHESPRRGENFVTRKITKWLGEFEHWNSQEFYTVGRLFIADDMIGSGYPASHGPSLFPKLRLGNIKAYRDWGHAKDYVRGMHMMLQQDKPEDFVIATGEAHSVEDFLEIAFSHFDLDWKKFVVTDPLFFRPAEVPYLRGNPRRAKFILGWQPEVSFKQLVEEMVIYDYERAKAKYTKGHPQKL